MISPARPCTMFPFRARSDGERGSGHHMLLRSGNAGTKLRAVVPLFLVDLLNDDIDIDFAEGANFEAPDVMPIVRALYRRRGKGVTKEELEDIQQSNAILLGKAALLVHRVSYFPVLVDAIAALSCEALKADIREFDLFPYGHAKNVASAMRTLLAGSSLVNPREGATSAHCIYSIPEAHGRLRESLKSATYLVAGRMNSGCRSPTTLSVLRSAGSLSINLQTLAVNSEARSRAVVFEMRYLTVSDELQQIRKLCNTMRGCFRHGGDAARARSLLAWEATIALTMLAVLLGETESEGEGKESLNKGQDLGQRGAQVIGKKEKEEVNQGPVTGKGTELVRQGLYRFLSERLRLRPEMPVGARLTKSLVCLKSSFRPVNPKLQAFLGGVKEFMERNGSRGVLS